MEEQITSSGRLREYLRDPFLKRLYLRVRETGPLRSISVDLADVCNIRCQGCYFFAENLERHPTASEVEFDAFVRREKTRGTNFVTVVGGEPSLRPERLRKLYANFKMNVATNGLLKIPYDGLENLPVGISVWGDHETDRGLRGGGKTDVFAKARRNYRDDPRAFWYYTVAPGHAREVESVVEQCIENGNYVLFNFYGDLCGLGGDLDYRRGFAAVRREIERMIARYPERILITGYLSRVVSTGRLYAERWGYEVCTSISPDNEMNRVRIQNGNPYMPHFRAYNADLVTTRRCCTGNDRDCASCFDVWEHFSWVMLNLRRHLGSKQEFTNWLTTVYLFYLINRMVDFEEGIRWLPDLHERSMCWESEEGIEAPPSEYVRVVA